MLYVVGVGPAKGYLTDRAKEIISKAEVVYGSRRAIEYAKDYIKGEARVLTKFNEDTYREIEREAESRTVVVLSTGDPMVSGLGTRLKGVVEPGISSIQLALAKLKVDLCEVVVVDAHGRNCYEEIEEALKFRGKVLILADRNFNPKRIKGRVIVLENLGFEGEKIGSEISGDLAIVYAEVENENSMHR